MDFKDILAGFAKIGLPILGAALPVPGGVAIGTALASLIGGDSTKPEDILAKLTEDAGAREKALEFQATHQETMLKMAADAERDRYLAEVDDRKSARTAAVTGGTSKHLFWLSLLLLTVCLGAEIAVLFVGYPKGVPDIIVGRVLGLLDSVALMVLAFWYGSSDGNHRTTELLAQSAPATPSKAAP